MTVTDRLRHVQPITSQCAEDLLKLISRLQDLITCLDRQLETVFS